MRTLLDTILCSSVALQSHPLLITPSATIDKSGQTRFYKRMSQPAPALNDTGSDKPQSGRRLVALDYLRAIAVLLVLVRHIDELPESSPAWLQAVFTPLYNLGWSGVDLFFVLSGFLVSGLLFEEYRRNQKISATRFLIRRGLKIYPSFYVVMLVFIAVMMSRGQPLPWDALIPELLFVQNYFEGVWRHTWTLAVEEHFYIGLAIFIAFLTKRKISPGENPFRLVPTAVITLLVACLVLRIFHYIDLPEQRRVLQKWTHFRIDSLGFGVCLSYFYHFHRERFTGFFNRWKLLLLTIAILLLAPFCFLQLSGNSNSLAFLLTAGFTALTLAFGIILGVTVSSCKNSTSPQSIPGRLFQTIGIYSYSIYLWHIPVKTLLPQFHTQLSGSEPGPNLTIFYYLVGSLVLGILFSVIIEYPILKWRNRRFPSKSDQSTPCAPASL